MLHKPIVQCLHLPQIQMFHQVETAKGGVETKRMRMESDQIHFGRRNIIQQQFFEEEDGEGQP